MHTAKRYAALLVALALALPGTASATTFVSSIVVAPGDNQFVTTGQIPVVVGSTFSGYDLNFVDSDENALEVMAAADTFVRLFLNNAGFIPNNSDQRFPITYTFFDLSGAVVRTVTDNFFSIGNSGNGSGSERVNAPVTFSRLEARPNVPIEGLGESLARGDPSIELQLDAIDVPAPVPLPAPLLLLAGALAALGGMARHRKARP